ncbi:MAG: hypothetical protein EXR11_07960 [Rhodospirillaceae bacterium]|nr:hypothetical protein [Rhodospirillaceae bacterium]
MPVSCTSLVRARKVLILGEVAMHLGSVRYVLLTSVAIATFDTSAWAQDQQAQVGGIEEIVVTARQRNESLHEIPLAIAAFTSEDIQKAGFRDFGDIALQTAGINFNPNMSGATPGRYNSVIRIRGVSVLSALPHVQATALFIDGVYSLGGAQVLPIQDLERIEIIKGPQSAFFGRNTFAGAVNYITKKPSLTAYEGKLDVQGATFDSYETNFQHTGPLVEDRLGYLLNVRLFNKGSQWTATDGGELGKQTSKSASLALYSEPTDNLDVKIRAFYQSDDDGPPAEAFLRGRTQFGADSCDGKTDTSISTGFPIGSVAGTSVTLRPKNMVCGRIPQLGEAGAPRVSANTSIRPAILSRVRVPFDGELATPQVAQASPDFLIKQLLQRKYIPGSLPTLDGLGLKRNTFRGSLNANYEFGNGYTATLTAGYNDMRVNWANDFDHTDVESWYSADPQIGKDKSAELRVSSPGEDRLRWLGGATYYKQTFLTSGAGGLALSTCAADPTCATGPGNFGLPATSGDQAKVWAGYGAIGYDVTDQLTVDLEFRYMQDQRTNTQSAGAGFRNFTEKFKQKTPRIILTYKPSDELTIYAQASRGTLPGVINGLVSICSPDAFLQPYLIPVGLVGAGTPSTASECAQIASQSPGGTLIASTPAQYLDSGEIGIKSNFLDGAANLNLTGYHYKWKNLPFGLTVRYFRDADNPALRDRLPNAFSNTLGFSTQGDATFKGAEVEAALKASDNWEFSGNLSWNKNTFTKLILTGAFSSEVRNPLRAGPTGALVRSADPTVISASQNFSGRTQIRYPKWQGNMSSTYTNTFTRDWEWFARFDAIYNGKTFADFANYSFNSAYWLVHTRIGVENKNLRMELFIRNLFNEKNWGGANAFTDFAVQGDLTFSAQGIGLQPQDKRTFGLRMNYTF